uniref:CU044_2847 family protein n=1 Tax=Frankia sp. CIT1 TaxID=2880974 RepID=UPI001EF5DC6E
ILARVQVEGPVDVGAGAALRRLAIDDLRETVEGVTQSVAQALRRVRPDEVSVEFGVELAVKTGKLTSVLAEGSSTASIKLTLTWSSGDALRTSAAGDGDVSPS